jgi:TolB-like protein
MLRSPGAATLVAGFVLAVRPLSAQCPDGSAPPCRSTARSLLPAPNSVAVLYFDNLSRDTADAYLADGLTEEVIVRLGQVHRIAVKSRYESQRFRSRGGLNPTALGQALNAANLVTGSVQRGGNRVRVRVELVRAATRERVWGEVFDRSSDDVLTIEDAIARMVVQRIIGQLLPEEQARLARRETRDPRAHDLYLRGNFYFSRYTEGDLRAAIDLYQQALARDSTYAEAYAGISLAWSWLADDWVAPLDAYPHAREAAEHAIGLDSTSAVAWMALAVPVIDLDRDFARAERILQRALVLDSNLAIGYMGLGHLRLIQGRLDESLVLLRRAWQLDSLSRVIVNSMSTGLFFAGRYGDVLVVAQRDSGRTWETEALIQLGRCDEAQARLRAEDFFERALVLACAKHTVEARETLQRGLARLAMTKRYFPADMVARVLVAVGDYDEAFRLLDRADAERSYEILWLQIDPLFDPVRTDQRFDALVRRIGLLWPAPVLPP